MKRSYSRTKCFPTPSNDLCWHNHNKLAKHWVVEMLRKGVNICFSNWCRLSLSCFHKNVEFSFHHYFVYSFYWIVESFTPSFQIKHYTKGALWAKKLLIYKVYGVLNSKRLNRLNRLFTDSHWSEFLKFINLGEGELSYKDILCYFTLSVVKLYYNIF